MKMNKKITAGIITLSIAVSQCLVFSAGAEGGGEILFEDDFNYLSWIAESYVDENNQLQNYDGFSDAAQVQKTALAEHGWDASISSWETNGWEEKQVLLQQGSGQSGDEGDKAIWFREQNGNEWLNTRIKTNKQFTFDGDCKYRVEFDAKTDATWNNNILALQAYAGETKIPVMNFGCQWSGSGKEDNHTRVNMVNSDLTTDNSDYEWGAWYNDSEFNESWRHYAVEFDLINGQMNVYVDNNTEFVITRKLDIDKAKTITDFGFESWDDNVHTQIFIDNFKVTKFEKPVIPGMIFEDDFNYLGWVGSEEDITTQKSLLNSHGWDTTVGTWSLLGNSDASLLLGSGEEGNKSLWLYEQGNEWSAPALKVNLKDIDMNGVYQLKMDVKFEDVSQWNKNILALNAIVGDAEYPFVNMGNCMDENASRTVSPSSDIFADNSEYEWGRWFIDSDNTDMALPAYNEWRTYIFEFDFASGMMRYYINDEELLFLSRKINKDVFASFDGFVIGTWMEHPVTNVQIDNVVFMEGSVSAECGINVKDYNNSSITVELDNSAGVKIHGRLYCAVFDGEQMKYCSLQDEQIEKGEKKVIEAEIKANLQTGDEIRVFFWDDNMNPLGAFGRYVVK